MMKEKLTMAKKVYQQIPTPYKYEEIIQNTVREGRKRRQKSTISWTRRLSIAAALVFGVFVSTLNVNAQFATSVAQIPILGEFAQLLTFKQHGETNPTYKMEVTMPQVQKDALTTYQKSLNALIETRVTEAMQAAKLRASDVKEAYLATGGAESDYHKVEIEIDYTVKYYNDEFLSFVIDYMESGPMFAHRQEFYNLDLQNDADLTLEQLYGKDYKVLIDEEVKRQMAEREESSGTPYFEGFTGIQENQGYYINSYGVPVIVFPKYDIGPGVLGIQEFEMTHVPRLLTLPQLVNYEVKSAQEIQNIVYPQISSEIELVHQEKINAALQSVVDKYQKPQYSDVYMNYRVNRMDDDLLSVSYMGSVHVEGLGNLPITDSVNVDLKTGELITLETFLNDDPVVRQNWEAFMTEKAIQKGLAGFEAEGVRMCFKDNRVVFYYMPLDDQARSFVYITVPLEELEPFRA